MKNNTFETIERSIARFESILQVDVTLDIYEKGDVRDIIDLLVKLYENSKPSDAS